VPTHPVTGQSGFGPHSRERCESSRSRKRRLIGAEHPHCSRQQLPSLRHVMVQSASAKHASDSAGSRDSAGGARHSGSRELSAVRGGRASRPIRGADASDGTTNADAAADSTPRPADGSGPPLVDPFLHAVATTMHKASAYSQDCNIVIFGHQLVHCGLRCELTPSLRWRRKLTTHRVNPKTTCEESASCSRRRGDFATLNLALTPKWVAGRAA
jgi:hypothetical protein